MKVYEVLVPQVTLIVEDVNNEDAALEEALKYLANMFQEKDVVHKLREISEHDIQITLIEDDEEE